MEYREIQVVLPKGDYLELQDIAQKHIIKVDDFAAQILRTFVMNYLKANSPLITDAHKFVGDSCQPTDTVKVFQEKTVE